MKIALLLITLNLFYYPLSTREQAEPIPSSHNILFRGERSDWKLFNSEEGNYSVLFPADPQIDKQELDIDKGKIKVLTAFVETPSVSYAVSCTVLPEKVDYADRVKEILDKTRSQTVEQNNGKLLEEAFGRKGY